MNSIKYLAAAAAMALPLQFAQAQDAAVNAQIVLPSITGYSGGMGVAVGYEAPMPQVDPNFSVEGEFTKSISNADDSYSDFFGTYKVEIDYYTLAAYAKYTMPVNPKMGLYGRAGLLYEKVEAKVSTPFGSASDTSSDTGLSLGFGMNYEINPKMDFTAGYTIIESDIKHLSAGIKFKL